MLWWCSIVFFHFEFPFCTPRPTLFPNLSASPIILQAQALWLHHLSGIFFSPICQLNLWDTLQPCTCTRHSTHGPSESICILFCAWHFTVHCIALHSGTRKKTEQGTTSVRKFARFCIFSACLLYVCCPCQSIGISRKMYEEKCFVCWSLPIYCNPQENAKGKTKKNKNNRPMRSTGSWVHSFVFFCFFWGGFPMCHISPLSMVFSFCMNVSLSWLPVCFCEHFAVLSLLTLPFPIMAIEGNNMRLLDAIEATEHLTLIDLHLHLHIHMKNHYTPTIQSQYNHNTNTCLQMFLRLHQKCIL